MSTYRTIIRLFGSLSHALKMKKKSTNKKGAASFEVRFVGAEVRPETVPIGLVSEALTALQDIAAGRDSFGESTAIPKDKCINLVDVKRGSAVYSIFSPEPEPAIQNLSQLGQLISNESKLDIDSLVSSLNPIEKLSRIARVIGCMVKVTVAGDKKNSILEIAGDVYDKLSKNIFINGTATLILSLIHI